MEKVRLEEIADIYLGLTHTPQYVEKGIPFLSVKDISNGEIDFSRCHYITEEEFNTLPVGAKPQVGDMLFCRVGTIGKPIIIKEGTSKFGSFVSLGFLRIKRKDYLIEYVKYWMNSNNFFQQVLKNVKGVAQVNLNTSWLKKFELPRIEIKEQKKVISQLDKLQKIIDLRKKQIEELEELIKSQFVEMFENEKYPKDEFINLSKEIYAGGDKPKDISRIKTEEYLYPVFANGYEKEGLQGYSKDYRTKDESVTISARGTIGYSFIREGKFTPIVRLITITPNERVNVTYLKYAIDNINIAGSGTSQAQLTVPNVKKQKIIVPPVELQNQFAEIVKQIDKQKFILEKTLKETEELQESIMNKYFR